MSICFGHVLRFFQICHRKSTGPPLFRTGALMVIHLGLYMQHLLVVNRYIQPTSRQAPCHRMEKSRQMIETGKTDELRYILHLVKWWWISGAETCRNTQLPCICRDIYILTRFYFVHLFSRPKLRAPFLVQSFNWEMEQNNGKKYGHGMLQ